MPDHRHKHAVPDHPILPVLAERWSPYVFDPRPVEREKLLSCLEAIRWAASSYNEQPWSFLIATREEPQEFARMLGCLGEPNQTWAKNAGVLMLTAYCPKFSRNGNPNRVAEHDLGLAMGNLCAQATSLGLCVHQMAGVDLAKVRATYAIPEGWHPHTAAAIGYPGDPTSGDPQLAPRDQAQRTRKPLQDFVFAGGWGKSAKL